MRRSTTPRGGTQHHFARLRVTANALRLKVYGFSGNGAPPAVMDSYEYRTGGCAGSRPRRHR